MTSLLEGRNAVIYGAGGAIGTAVACAFATEGARLFLAGRSRGPLERVAAEIAALGGSSEVAVVDALDAHAVDSHAREVAARAGRIDISFNLISRGDVQGVPLLDLGVDDFMAPLLAGLRGNFLTATAAARLMVAQRSGVILCLNSGSGTSSSPARARAAGFLLGGTGPADAGIDAFVRHLASEVGTKGIRVVGIWTAGVQETVPVRLRQRLAPQTALNRLPTLAQVADTAVYLASDRAASITGTYVSVTSGLVPA